MKFIDNIDINHYTDFILQNDYCTIFQSPEWSQIKDNWDFKRVGVVDDNNNLLATAQILIRKGMWYLPRGPLLDYNNIELLNYFLENLAKYARNNKAKLVKIDIPKPLNNERLEAFNKESENLVDKNILNAFKSNKFSHRGLTMKMSDTIQPRFNAVTMLEDFPEKLPKHTKRLLKDVDKRFVEVRQVGIDKLDDLMFVLECTENRKNISLRNRDYFKKLMELYKERALVYIAYLDIANALAKTREKQETLEQEILKLGENMHKKRKTLEDQFNSTKKLIEFFESFNSTQEEILCGVISIAYGKNAEMLYAGMNDKFSKIPAQYKTYVDSMLKMKELGCTTASMGGIEGDLNDSLLAFKSNFTPNIVEHYGEFDLVISHTFNLMYNYGLPLRRKILKLIKR